MKSGQATAASLLRVGIAGRAPLPQTSSRKASRAVAAVAHDPQRHAGEPVEEPGRQRQLVRLARREREGDRAAPPVRDHARLGAEARRASGRAPRGGPAGRGPPFLGAPAALGCALMLVPSRNAMPSSTPRACAASSSRGHAPELGPADEELGGPPPRAELGRHGPPLGAVRVPPDDRLHRPPQVPRRRLALRPARLHERLQRRPPLVRQHQPPDPAPHDTKGPGF